MSPTSASATTFVDTRARSRSPPGRYHHRSASVLHTTLRRSSLPVPPRPDAPPLAPNRAVIVSPPAPPNEPGLHGPEEEENLGRLGGLRRMFSGRKAPVKEPKNALKPLLLPVRHGLHRARSASAQGNGNNKANLVRQERPPERRRLSLGGWFPLPGTSSAESSAGASSAVSGSSTGAYYYYGGGGGGASGVNSPTASPRLKPLVLPRRSSEAAATSDLRPQQTAENVANIIAWLLDCIQRDVIPQWGAALVQEEEEQPQMLLQDGKARCLVVRAKRRSALF